MERRDKQFNQYHQNEQLSPGHIPMELMSWLGTGPTMRRG